MQSEKFCLKIFTCLSIVLSIILEFSIISQVSMDKVKAEEGASYLDVVFALDASQSMKSSDPNNIRYEAIKMFLDMSNRQGDSAGFAAYSDQVVKEAGLVQLNSEEDKQKFYANLGNIKLGEWTDIGLGLKEAVKLIKSGHTDTKKPLIILLSDGKNDPSRDENLSEGDLSSALEEARNQKFPVYTIALNADGTVDKNQLEKVSSETSGKAYIANSAAELTAVLKDIYIDVNKAGVLADNSITANGDFQDVTVNIPDSSIMEANISILSSSSVEIKVIDPDGREQLLPNNNIIVSKSDNYSVVKLINPMKGSWTLKVKGNKGEKIDTSLVSNSNISAAMNLDSSTKIHKGEKLKISAYLQRNQEKVTDGDLYKNLSGKLMVRKLPDSKAEEVKLTLKGNSFEGEYVAAQKGEYEFAILLQSEAQAIKSEAITLTTENNAPQAISTIENIVLSPDGKAVKIDLANYFKDTDDDELVYSALNNTEQFVKTSISGSTLEIIPVNKGQANIKITAKDTAGAAVSQTFNIKVNSKIMQFLSKSYVLMILMLVIFTSVIIIIMAHRKVSSYK